MEAKQCRRCNETKSINEFFLWKRSSDGFDYHCKACKRKFNLESYYRNREKRIAQTKKWASDNKEYLIKFRKEYYQKNKPKAQKQSRTRKLAKYGLTLQQYDALLKEQQGICAICKKESWRNLAVDHDHTTSKVRGLLCHKCNAILGYATDSKDILQSAISYLKYADHNPPQP